MGVIKYFGPPGTGKTRTLIGILNGLAKRYAPDRIGFYSFTRAAAYDAKKRAVAVTGKEWKDFSHFGTIHSECFKQLNLDKAQVLDEYKFAEFCEKNGYEYKLRKTMVEEALEFGMDIYDVVNIDNTTTKMYALYQLSRELMVPPEKTLHEYLNHFPEPSYGLNVVKYRDFIKKYNLYKEKNGLFDFSDFVEICLKEGLVPELDVVFIDECQDLTRLEWEYVKRLIANSKIAFIAGDVDQTIYVWRGAAPQYFLNFPGKDKMLTDSHRVPIAVWKKAFNLIKRNHIRKQDLIYLPKNEKGEFKYIRDINHLDFDQLLNEKTFILSRNWFFLKEIAKTLERAAIPFLTIGLTSLYKKSIVDAIMALEKIRKKEPVVTSDLKALFKLISAKPWLVLGAKTKIQKEKKERFYNFDEYKQFMTELFLNKISKLEDALDVLKIDASYKNFYLKLIKKGIEYLQKEPTITLASIHWSKGLEADNVILVSNISYKTLISTKVYPEDERRVFYVGMTRAKKRLYILEPSYEYFYEELFK